MHGKSCRRNIRDKVQCKLQIGNIVEIQIQYILQKYKM